MNVSKFYKFETHTPGLSYFRVCRLRFATECPLAQYMLNSFPQLKLLNISCIHVLISKEIIKRKKGIWASTFIHSPPNHICDLILAVRKLNCTHYYLIFALYQGMQRLARFLQVNFAKFQLRIPLHRINATMAI